MEGIRLLSKSGTPRTGKQLQPVLPSNCYPQQSIQLSTTIRGFGLQNALRTLGEMLANITTDQIKNKLRSVLFPCAPILLLAGPVLAQKPELVIQTGHLDTVRALAISADSKLLASAGADKTIILWEVATGKQLFSFRGHSEWIFSLAFSPQGELLASGSSDGTVKLWNVTEGRQEYEISLKPFSVTFVAFSLNGDTLAIASSDKVIKLWDMPTRRMKADLRGHTETVTQVAFSPDGKHLASSSLDGTLRIWNLATMETDFCRVYEQRNSALFRAYDFKNPVEMVRKLRYVNDPLFNYLRRQFTASTVRLLQDYDGSIPLPDQLETALIDEFNRLVKGTLLFDKRRFVEVKLEKETKRLLGSNPKGEALIRLNRLLLEDACPFGIASSEDNGVTSLAYSPDGNLIAFGTADNNISVWDVRTRESRMRIPPQGLEQLPRDGLDPRRFLLLFRLGGGLYRAGAIAFTSNKELAFVDGFKCRLWDVGSNREKLSHEMVNGGGSFAVTVSKDGNILAFNDGQGVQVRNVISGEVKQLKGGFDRVNAVTFSSDGRALAALFGGNEGVWGDEFGISEQEEFSMLGNLMGEGFAHLPSKNMICTIRKDSNGKNSSEIDVMDIHSVEISKKLEADTNRINSIAANPKGTILASSSEDGTIRIWDVSNWMVTILPQRGDRIIFSPDGTLLASGSENGITLWDVKTWKNRVIANHEKFKSILFSPNSKMIAASGNLLQGSLSLWEVSTGKHLHSLRLDASPKHTKSLSNETKEQITSALIGDIRAFGTASGPVAFSPDNRFVAGPEINFLSATYRIKIWNVKTGKVEHTLSGHYASIRSIAFSPNPNGNVLASSSWDQTIKLWNSSKGEELATIMPRNERDWVIFTPSGRFDTSTNIEEVQMLNWALPGDVLNPLPLDIFMRDYWEPKLLQRILEGEEFRSIRDISKLNWTQPGVRIKEVKPDSANTVQVTVEVANIESHKQHDKRGEPLQSGVYDVRLFRDKQMVAHSTTNEALTEYVTKAGGPRDLQDPDEQELELWRRANVVMLESNGTATLTFRGIKLPRNVEGKEVEFSAYAFNNDRVKSRTDHLSFIIPAELVKKKGRAYVISIGVNIHQNQSLNFEYSVTDAREIQRVVPGKLALAGDYADIVQVSLISDYSESDNKIELVENNDIKRSLKAVLDLLAGRQVDAETKNRIPNAERLQEAQPDDFVLISFSSHGYVDMAGNFVFVLQETDDILGRSLSSEELSLWLRDIDAGEMIMIVDACYSAAAIQGKGFKPGPMGSRGLGQLSYDKAMRILAATQPNDPALGAEVLGEGLLTYALIKDGIEKGWADFSPKDKKITVSEWLEYAEYRVPKLFQEIIKREKEGNNIGGLVQQRAEELKIQHPLLFDFSRKQRDSVIVRQ